MMPFPSRSLRLTEDHQSRFRQHLFPGDGCESVALALCGTRFSDQHQVFCIHEIVEIPDDTCSLRTPVAVRWPLEPLIPLLNKAMKRGLWVLKIHSHPKGFEHFSSQDDETDRLLSASLRTILERDASHLSAIMTADGGLRVRLVDSGCEWPQFDRVMVVGDEIQFAGTTSPATADEADLRTRQAFGEGTTAVLKSLSVGVAGCSGTGSWVIEMLARLGVGRLVLVDPDKVERKNLNRIVNSKAEDVRMGRLKVEMLRDAIGAMGLGTRVETFPCDLANQNTIKALADCDLLFGCLDSADGRDLLNRIATYYLQPYFDLGVRLDADGKGGIEQICCAIHYLLPGGSSLLSRGVITAEQVGSQALYRTNPQQHAALQKEGYIKGIAVDRPAVVSLNGFAASHAVNEMLARLHPYRRDPNVDFRFQTFSLADGAWLRVPDGQSCALLSRHVGRGDAIPLLGNPALS
jgi:hypothetical protein